MDIQLETMAQEKEMKETGERTDSYNFVRSTNASKRYISKL